MDGRGHRAKHCQDKCATKGMAYSAREWRGQCFCSDHNDYGKHETASGYDCCGSNVGLKKMCALSVAGQIKVMVVLEKEGSKRLVLFVGLLTF